jgi:hypothetical protein
VKVANGSTAGEYNFRTCCGDLHAQVGREAWMVLVNGDAKMDLAGKTAFSCDLKKMMEPVII